MGQSTSKKDRKSIWILFGMTQSGKSTFLKYVYEYMDLDSSIINVGNSTLSCTSSVRLYNVQVDVGKYIIVRNGKEVKVPNIEKAKYSVVDNFNIDHKLPEYNLAHKKAILSLDMCIMDTPGLGDSNGNLVDEDNMFEIIGGIKYFNRISGVLIFHKYGTPYSKSFIEFIRYYLKIVNRNIIVIHTNWCFPTIIQNIKEHNKIKDTMISEFRNTFAIDCKHIFIDTLPDKVKVYEQLLTSESFLDLIKTIKSCNMYDVSNLQYPKTNRMLELDTNINIILLSNIKSLEDILEVWEPIHNNTTSQIIAKQGSLKQLEDVLESNMIYVRTHDTYEKILMSTHTFNKEANILCWYPEVVLDTHTKYQITKIDKTCRSTYNSWKNEIRQCKYYHIVLEGDFGKDVKGEVKIYTDKRCIYENEISECKSKIRQSEGSIETLHEDIKSLNREIINCPDIVQLRKTLKDYSRLLIFVKTKYIDIQIYEDIKQLYRITVEKVEDIPYKYFEII